jgi:hypothetical protein
LHCICVCDCDGRHESLIMLSHSVMVRHSHLLARCYLGTMCMCTTGYIAEQIGHSIDWASAAAATSSLVASRLGDLTSRIRGFYDYVYDSVSSRIGQL